jgi:hypothetical protein
MILDSRPFFQGDRLFAGMTKPFIFLPLVIGRPAKVGIQKNKRWAQ